MVDIVAERWHKTLRAEFLTGKVFASLDDAQGQLDAWVRRYGADSHRSVGDPRGRLLGQLVLRRHQLPGSATPTGAAKCRSLSSATPSRSRR